MREGLSGAARGKIRLEGEPMAGYTMTMARPRIDDGDNAVKHPMGPDPADDGPQPVSISAGGATLGGELQIPAGAVGIVLFAHGSGSSRHSPRNRLVGKTLP